MMFPSTLVIAMASSVLAVAAANTANHSMHQASKPSIPCSAVQGRQPQEANYNDVVGQLRGTLQNVLRSVEDEGHSFSTFVEQRHSWCSQGLLNWTALANASADELEFLRIDVEEREAAVEEMDAAAQQAHANMALVQHTIKQATLLLDAPQLQDAKQNQQLRDLLFDRRAALSALQSELQVVSPTLARLRADAAEVQRRADSRKDAVEAIGAFVAALRNSCSTAVEHEDDRASLRLTAGTALHDALQALDKVGAPGQPVRSQEVTARSANSATVAGRSSQAQRAMEALEKEEEQEDAEDAAVETDISFVQVVSSSAKGKQHVAPSGDDADFPTIDELVARMKKDPVGEPGHVDSAESPEHAEWCSRERVRNNFAMTFMQDLSAQMTTESQLHDDSGTQLSADVAKLQSEYDAVQNVSLSAARSVSEEARLATTAARDVDLASKILSQAAAVFAELRAPGGPLQSDEAAAHVAQALQRASQAFAAASAAQHEGPSKSNSSAGTMQQLAEAAEAAAQSINRETLLLQKQRKRHALQKGLCDQRRSQYDNQANEAADYLKHLEDECGSNAESPSQQRRTVELRALQDSKRVLQGLRPVRSNPSGVHRGLLRGATSGAREGEEQEEGAAVAAGSGASVGLGGEVTAFATPAAQQPSPSPLERAAAEMGVQVEG